MISDLISDQCVTTNGRYTLSGQIISSQDTLLDVESVESLKSNMTKETLLQELSDKIREVCPELMELSPGCTIEYEIPPLRAIYIGVVADVQSKDDRYPTPYIRTEIPGKLKTIRPPTYCIRKIIGHPIQLQHVLRAIEEKEPSKLRIQSNGYMYYEAVDYVDIQGYDLTLPFESQSVKTMQFLHDIICKELIESKK